MMMIMFLRRWSMVSNAFRLKRPVREYMEKTTLPLLFLMHRQQLLTLALKKMSAIFKELMIMRSMSVLT
jgi:hypothetical protein